MRSTCLEISGKILSANAGLIRSALPKNVLLTAVVKADAYGHGLGFAAQSFLAGGADRLAVAIAEEATALREAGIAAPILILGGGDMSSMEEAALADAAHAIFTPAMLSDMQNVAKKLGRRVKAHLKIDTGMSRIGARGLTEISAMLDMWKNCPEVEMEGIFTHFCVSETDPEFTARQDKAFTDAVNMARARGFTPIAHAAATGAFLDARYMHDMVRPGLAMYGFGADIPGLEGAQRLVARPVRFEKIAAGDTVSYGRIFRAERDTMVMTVPIGYGDGYPRLLSGRTRALVRGKSAPQIGRVCMDMTMFDVTDIPEASLSDEVVLMGRQGNECITPVELSDICGTIPYEIMLGFMPRVRRRLV